MLLSFVLNVALGLVYCLLRFLGKFIKEFKRLQFKVWYLVFWNMTLRVFLEGFMPVTHSQVKKLHSGY